MKKSIITLLSAGIVVVAGLAEAGQYVGQPVLLGTTWAQGSVVSARTSADSKQWIGCRVNSYSSGSETGICWAYDSTGAGRTCSITSPTLLATAKSIGQTSFVRFEFSGSTCTRLDVIQSSQYTSY